MSTIDGASRASQVFVSYSHDAREHMDRVLALCDRLRREGVEAELDQYEPVPPEGWPLWTARKVEQADFVLVVCTETYRRRFDGHEEAGKGLGVRWEGSVVVQALYDAGAQNDKFLPVLFSRMDEAHIPGVLRGTTRFLVSDEEGYEELYRHLTAQPAVPPPDLGARRDLPPKLRRMDFSSSEAEHFDGDAERVSGYMTESLMAHYDVFLSHASADKPAVEHLARKLKKEGLKPFLDKWHLIPGAPWQEALEEALDQSRTCAVFLGKALGPWQNEEMRSALEEQVRNRSYRVIPVLLPGGKQPGDRDLPRFLRRRTWVDFHASLDDEDTFLRFLAGIRGEAPGPDGRGEPHSLSDKLVVLASEQPARRFRWKWGAGAVILSMALVTALVLIFTYENSRTARPESSVVAHLPVLQGEVLDAQTGEPLAGVEVRLPKYDQAMTTDATGKYHFEVPASNVTSIKVRATRLGYRSLNLDLPPGDHLNTHQMRRNP